MSHLHNSGCVDNLLKVKLYETLNHVMELELPSWMQQALKKVTQGKRKNLQLDRREISAARLWPALPGTSSLYKRHISRGQSSKHCHSVLSFYSCKIHKLDFAFRVWLLAEKFDITMNLRNGRTDPPATSDRPAVCFRHCSWEPPEQIGRRGIFFFIVIDII